MTLNEARALLGVDDDTSPEDIRRAYLEKARTRHPDLNGGAHGALMADLNEARKMATDEANAAWCNNCGGKGSLVIVSGFYSSSQVCSTCHGTGKRWP